MDQSPSIVQDLVPAPGRSRRFVAWLVDYLIVMVPGLTLVGFAVATLVQTLPGFIGAVAAEAGWSRVLQLFIHRRTLGVGDMAADEWVGFAQPLFLALFAVPVLQFGYQATMLVWRRRTVGMMIADVRLDGNRCPGPVRRRAGIVRAAVITFVDTGLVAVALALMVMGQFTVGVAVWGVAVVAFWVDALAALGPGRRTVIDRVTGAVAVRRGFYPAAARVASASAAVAARRTADAAITAGRAVSDAAAVTGHLAREGTAALAQTAPVRQILDSRVAAQAHAIHTAGVERVQEFGSEAGKRARALGGQARSLWQDRRAGRSDAAHELPASTERDEQL